MNNLEEIKKRKVSRLITMLILYIPLVFFSFHLIHAVSTTENLKQAFLTLNKNMTNIKFFYPNLNEVKLVALISGIFFLYTIIEFTDNKKFMPTKEHGSAKWCTNKEKRQFKDKELNKNIILSDNVYMSLNTEDTRRNLNVLVLGGSGAGKTRFFVKPNLMQCNSSYVVTDPKGDLFRETGEMMKDNGYIVKVLNLKDFEKSMKYNPFTYIKKDSDVFKLIKMLIKNTNGDSNGSDDPFWEKAETALLEAIFFYLYYEAPKSEKNLSMVFELLQYAQVREDDEEFESDLDILFKMLERENENHIAVKQYKIFKTGAGKTGKSILISALSRLSFLGIPSISELFETDELQLELIGDRKTILYVIIPDSDTSFNFIVSMMYTQLFDVLYDRADNVYKGCLPVHVRFLLDEFANIGKIPDFEKRLATMRSRSISSNIILQSLNQIEGLYKKTYKSIIDNCDNVIFLGGQETSKWVSEKLGKMTIDSKVINQTKGKSGGSSINYSILGRELMTPREVEEMRITDCIVFIRGISPIYDRKYRIEKHENYCKLGNDFSFEKLNKGSFNVEKLNFLLEEIKSLEYEIDYE